MHHVREPSSGRSLRPEHVRQPSGLQQRMPETPARPVRDSIALTASALTLGWLLCSLPAQAVEFGEGEFQGRMDTTLTHGMTFRVQDRSNDLITNPNADDGNRNYDPGLISNTSKFTTDLELDYRNFGAFVRASGFVDFENQNGERERTQLSDEAKELVGKNVDVLDAYVTGTFEAGEALLDVRAGKHVLNWGESTFIQNGINAINPFDVSKLRQPGSELREALVAVPLVSASVAPTDTLSVEGFYQLAWEETEIDPVGTYFSTSDYVGPGANKAVVAIPGLDLGDMGLTAENNPFTSFSATSVAGAFSAVTAPDDEFLIADRGPDHAPDDSGQWGIALRYFAEELNNTEFGFHYTNYHSRLPLISAHTGRAVDAGAGLAVAGGIAAAAGTAVEEIVRGAVAEALFVAQCPSPIHSPQCAALAGGVQAETTALFRDRIVPAAASAAAIDAYIENGHYFIEYPEDIQLFGVSFNTEIGATGWALQGEYSYRRDAPLQLAERKVFIDALGPFTGLEACIAGEIPQLVARGTTLAVAQMQAPGLCIAKNDQAGLYDVDTIGYTLRDVSQIQATATRVFGPVLGSDSGAFVTEVALMHVHDMPDGKGADEGSLSLRSDLLPLESPAARVGSDYNDADATSWGYRLAARLDYNNAVGAMNLFPYLQFGHDVSGNSPLPSGSFVEGRTALTLGVSADYLSRWQANLGYTRYAGDSNDLRDRDFIAGSIKYSF